MNIIEPLKEETYQTYIDRILSIRPNVKDNNNYQELHHIIPKCLGGDDNFDNLIWLYAQEHYYAHKILAIENPDNKGLQYAWWMMSHQSSYKITSNEYEEIRSRFSKIHSNRIVSDITRKKLSDIHKGKNLGEDHWNFGRHRPDCVKEKISLSRIGKYTNSNNPNAKKVLCIETGDIFDTMLDAANFAGVKISAISNNCHGRSKKVKNKYTFKIIE